MTETQIKQGKPLSPFAQRMMHAASVAGAIATVIFCIWAYQKGLFTSQEALSEYMNVQAFGDHLFLSYYKFYKLLFQLFRVL